MSELHDRAKQLFLDSLSCPAAERGAFLATACDQDAELRKEVESLLAFHVESDAGVDANFPLEPGDVVFLPGDVFAGRYRMVTRLGRGGMGDVWRADDLILQIPVAVKLMRGANPDGPGGLNEVRLARQITHPAVCRVFDVGQAGHQVFFTMEFVQGEDLSALLRRVGRLSSEKVVDIGRQLCEGLAAAHGAEFSIAISNPPIF